MRLHLIGKAFFFFFGGLGQYFQKFKSTKKKFNRISIMKIKLASYVLGFKIFFIPEILYFLRNEHNVYENEYTLTD